MTLNLFISSKHKRAIFGQPSVIDRDSDFARPCRKESRAARAFLLLQDIARSAPDMGAEQLDEIVSDICARLYGCRDYETLTDPRRYYGLSNAIHAELQQRNRGRNGTL